MVPMEEGVIKAPWNSRDQTVLMGDAVAKVSR
jgi:hypothetical protein